MNEEEFSPEYFQHLLSALTLNSRALIVELTSLAEKFVDNAQEIVQLIDERITKILPKYKLCSFYLMDSIIKNIGNPYNILFAKNLFKNFTESYSIIDDTPTRQNMINLFKTWVNGKTGAGLDLFPKDTLLKVEKFIIQATSLNTSVQHHDIIKITRDTILRESNYLLQYVISLDDEVDNFLETKLDHEESTQLLRSCRISRNYLILEINHISEGALLETRDEFERKKDYYVERLREIRKNLDDHNKKQHEIFEQLKEFSLATKDDSSACKTILINLTPKNIDISSLFEEKSDNIFEAAIRNWGICQNAHHIPRKQTVLVHDRTVLDQDTPLVSGNLAGALGINIDAVAFEGVATKTQGNHSVESLSGELYENDNDGYDPELTFNEAEIENNSSTGQTNGTFIPGKSSLKRAHCKEERTVKRVRFEI